MIFPSKHSGLLTLLCREKRVRFPKGKKVKQGDHVLEPSEELPGWKDPRLAAKDRAIRRNKFTSELLNDESNDFVSDVRKAEVEYEVTMK